MIEYYRYDGIKLLNSNRYNYVILEQERLFFSVLTIVLEN